ncbi:hypothetical protein K439DRAFT_472863 [Ramaria rubella]|nr:hypothetical protein K439DRAFT_472863 [Ramaria rubella]
MCQCPKTQNDPTTRRAAQRVQTSILLNGQSREYSREKKDLEAELQIQQDFISKQRDSVQQVVVELQEHIGLLNLLMQQGVEGSLRSNIAKAEQETRLEDLVAQLVSTRLQRDRATKEMKVFEGLVEDERTVNANSMVIIDQLEQQNFALRQKTESLEHQLKVKKSRDRFWEAGYKVLQTVRRKRRLTMAVRLLSLCALIYENSSLSSKHTQLTYQTLKQR